MARFNVKQAFVQHVEKGVFGVAILIVLIGLATTDWAPYSGTPDQITQKVSESRTRLLAGAWPVEEREKFVLTQDDSPANIVHQRLYSKLDPTPIEMSAKMVVDVFSANEPVREPKMLAVEDVLVKSGRAYLHQLDPIDEDEEAMADLFAQREDPEEGIADELKSRQTPGLSMEGLDPSMLGSRDIRSLAGELLNTSTSVDMSLLTRYQSMLGGSGIDLSALGLDGLMSENGALPPPMNGKGYHVVSVRGVFPLREQIKQFAEAINKSYPEAASVFDIRDFELERQVMLPGPDPWSGEWTRVDLDTADEVLSNATGFDTDVVNSIITNAVITMPLPMRISGRWVELATHPRIKKFELTEDQMALEVEMQRRLLEEAAEQQKQLDETTVKRGGFTKHTFDNRELQSTVMGGGYSMFNIGAGYDLMAMASAHGYSVPSGMAGAGAFGGGLGSGRGSRSARGTVVDPMTDMVQKLTKGLKTDKEKKDMEAKIRRWVGDRMSADGELLLYRFLDFSAEPGQTYRYRVRLVLANPNFGKRIADAGGLEHVVQGETRQTPWSEPTEPVSVPPDIRYFLTDIRDLSVIVLPKAGFDVYQWDPQHGTSMNAKLEIRLGQQIGDSVKTTVIDPAQSKYTEEEYRFASHDFLVDLLEDIQLEQDFHEKIDDGTAVKFVQGSRGRFQLPPRALVRSEDGLKQLSPALNSKEHNDHKRYQEQQAKTYAYLKPVAEGGLAGLDPSDPEALRQMIADGGLSMDMLNEFGGGKRMRSQLKKKVERAVRSGRMPEF